MTNKDNIFRTFKDTPKQLESKKIRGIRERIHKKIYKKRVLMYLKYEVKKMK